ncbi:MAG: serine/threonine protein kinase [Myxococcales bacterium]|nr:serine/threonine protein kinase [Myxococcales bacterium]
MYALLGKGGFGAVYSTRHVHTGQELVVKVLRANMAHDPVQLRRFLNEAKAACQLTHPHTVRVFDFGQTDEKQLYMAMERLHGKELADVLKVDAPLDPFRTIHIAIGVLKSLSEAHAAGLVHRDLKPGNIFLCDVHGESDFVKLIDFGIAKSYEDDAQDHDLTKTGFAIGTPKYMSPEQGRAEPLDGRSDLYSLGIILYEALTGSVPFTATSAMSMIVKHLQTPPPPILERVSGKMPDGLAELVMRSLAKDPLDRFSDADDMRAALESILESAGRPVAERGRAVSAKFRAIPETPPGMAGLEASLDADPETAVTPSPAKAAGPAAKAAEAAGDSLRDQAAQQAPTVAIDTGKQKKIAEPQAAPAAPQASVAKPNGGEKTEKSDKKAPKPPGINTRLVAGAAQPSVVPSTPSRPSRNRADRPTRRDKGGGGRLLVTLIVFVAIAGAALWFWAERQGSKPADVLAAAATEIEAQIGTSVREPLAARTGTRERKKPRLKKGSALREESEKFHANRFKGVGKKRQPLSTKEIDKVMSRTDGAMMRCVRKHGDPGVAVTRISLDMEIAADGRVSSVEVNGDLSEGQLGKCIVGVAKRVRFRSDIPSKQSLTAFVGFQPTKGRRTAPAKPRKRKKRAPKAPKAPVYDGDSAL